MTVWMISALLAFPAGYAACWFTKTAAQKLVVGANALSAKLHAEADKLKASV